MVWYGAGCRHRTKVHAASLVTLMIGRVGGLISRQLVRGAQATDV